MCGIIGKTGNITQSTLPLELLKHRGPDSNGAWTNNRNCILGHTRLSILDLDQRASQPMIDESKRYILVYNGEIYNYKELKEQYLPNDILKTTSDTEILLLLWKKMGVECLQLLNGMFAFALWDDAENKLWLAKDHLGKKPLMYGIFDNTLFFASELNALTSLTNKSLEINHDAIDLFLGYQFIPEPHTIYKKIYKLPPAHYALWDGNTLKIDKYWELDFSPKCIRKDDSSNDESKLAANLENKIRESIRYRLRSDVPVGTLLSGGVDSSLITAIAAQESASPIKTFSIGFHNEAYNEIPYANSIAKKYNTDHHSYILSEDKAAEYLMKSVHHYGEPYGDKSSLPSLMVCDLASEHVKVALNGDGGDELLAGYPKYNVSRIQNIFANIGLNGYSTGRSIEKIRQYLPTNFLDKMLNEINIKAISPFHRVLKFESFIRTKERRYTYQKDFYDLTQNTRYNHEQHLIRNINTNNELLNQILNIDYYNYLANDLLVKMDIASMAFGLETRSPLLDHTLLEYTATYPVKLKIKRGMNKYLLKKIAEKYLPKELIYRPKQGFAIPVNEWMKSRFNPLLRDLISDNNNPIWNFLRKGSIQSFLKEHENGTCHHGSRLWVVMILGLWLDTNKNRLLI